MKTIRVVAAVIRDGENIFATMRGYGDWLPADSGLIEKIEKALALLPS